MAVKNINFRFLNEKDEKEELTFPYPWRNTKMGQPINKAKAKRIVKNKVWDHETGDFDASIVFEAAPLLLLLSQEGCTGIRFYQAKKEIKGTEENNETLVLVGVDSENNDLNIPKPSTNSTNSTKILSIMTDSTPQERSIIIEVGGGNKLKEFI